MRKILFIGESGSGKSHAARELLRGSGVPTVLVNDRSTDPLEPGETRISWADAVKSKNVNMIVEDLIRCSKAELETLQLILNYNARHDNLPNVILIAHSITSVGIYPVRQYVSHICFMTERTSLPSLEVVLRAFETPKDEAKAKRDAFRADVDNGARANYGYWVFDIKTKDFSPKPGTLAAGGSAVAGASSLSEGSAVDAGAADLAAYRRTADKYVPVFHAEPKRSLAIFDFLLEKMPLQSLDAKDLTFTLRQKRTGRVVKVSLLDYIDCLTTQRAPGKDVLALHAYLQRFAVLPRCFIANRHRGFAAGLGAGSPAGAPAGS